MAKHQTGMRIDRILFKQFQEICKTEKLRPGEAVESLLRLAVQAGSITGVSIDNTKADNSMRKFDDALFRSKLARLKASLELEERYWKETGRELEDKESEYWVKELTELGRRAVSSELVKEFEACLANADKFYEEAERCRIQEEIEDHRTRTVRDDPPKH